LGGIVVFPDLGPARSRAGLGIPPVTGGAGQSGSERSPCCLTTGEAGALATAASVRWAAALRCLRRSWRRQEQAADEALREHPSAGVNAAVSQVLVV
jgi:hypothetical protein